MKTIKLLIFIMFAGAIAASIWWIKKNPDVWEKYKPTKVEVREKIQKPVEKAVESVVEKVKVHKDSELEPAAAVPEPMEIPVVEPVEVEMQVEEEPNEGLVKVEQSYEKPLTSEEAISILQALKGQKEPE